MNQWCWETDRKLSHTQKLTDKSKRLTLNNAKNTNETLKSPTQIFSHFRLLLILLQLIFYNLSVLFTQIIHTIHSFERKEKSVIFVISWAFVITTSLLNHMHEKKWTLCRTIYSEWRRDENDTQFHISSSRTWWNSLLFNK